MKTKNNILKPFNAPAKQLANIRIWRLIFSIGFIFVIESFSAQGTVSDTVQVVAPTDLNEAHFSKIVQQKAKTLKAQRKDTSDKSEVKVPIIQRNLSLTASLPSGFDTLSVFRIKLNVGLTQNGSECFSDEFILNRNTAKAKGSALYVDSNKMNFEVTVRGIVGDPVYTTITVTDKSGGTQTITGQYDLK